MCLQFLFLHPNQLSGQSNVDVRHTALKGKFVLYAQFIMIKRCSCQFRMCVSFFLKCPKYQYYSILIVYTLTVPYVLHEKEV